MSAAGITRATAALAEMEARITHGQSAAQASLSFHEELVKASHNDILVKVNDFLLEMLKNIVDVCWEEPLALQAAQQTQMLLFG